MQTLTLTGEYLLSESLCLESLTIAPDAKLSAPDGKLVTLTVGGVEYDPLPGTYTGDVCLTLTDPIPAPIAGMHSKPGDPPTPFRAAVHAGADGVNPDTSIGCAYQNGTISGQSLSGGSIESHGEDFNDIVIDGGSYTLSGVQIRNTGHSTNEGMALGSAVLVGGSAEAVLENMDIRTQGIRNSALVAGNQAAVTVRNSHIQVEGGTPEQIQAVQAIRPGKACMTYVGGGWGTTRAINVLNDASMRFENCRITSENWGVLSTDGIDSPKEFRPVKTRIYAKDCDVEITGRYGYGSYSIGDCKNIFDHTRIRTPDVAFKVANELAGGEFINGCDVYGGRFGVMFQSNQGGTVSVQDSTIASGRTTFIARSCFPNIQCERAVLNPGNGVILQMFDSDDPGFGKPEIEVDTEEPVRDPSHDVTQANYHEFSIWGFPQERWCTDLQASFKDMTIYGDFYNGITNAAKPKMMPGMGAAPGGPGGPEKPGGPDALGGAPGGMPPMAMPKNYPINLILTLDHVTLEGIISASRCRHASKTISGENRREIYQVYDAPSPVVNNGVVVTLQNGTVWTVTGKSYLSALHIDETSSIRTPDGCAVRLVVNGETIPYAPGDYTGDILVSAYQVETPAFF